MGTDLELTEMRLWHAETGDNDLEMLKAVGFGVAMGNAEESVKAVADYVTDTNEEEGVAKAVEKFALR